MNYGKISTHLFLLELRIVLLSPPMTLPLRWHVTHPRESLELKRRLRLCHIHQHFLVLKKKNHFPLFPQSMPSVLRIFSFHWWGKGLQAQAQGKQQRYQWSPSLSPPLLSLSYIYLLNIYYVPATEQCWIDKAPAPIEL